MGYKSLIEIHLAIAIIFNKNKQKKDQQQPNNEKTKQLQPDHREMHYNHKEKEKQKTMAVRSSSTCPNNAVFVFQPYKWNPNEFQFFIIDQNRWWVTSRKIVKVSINLSYIRRRSIPKDLRPSSLYYYPKLISSHRGILLFQHMVSSGMYELVLILYNPHTRQQVTATVPCKKYIFCAFFFHMPTQEYRVLYQLREDRVVSPSPSAACRYMLLGIRSGSFREIVSSPCCPNYCYPDTSTPPVISNGALHWMVSTEIKDDEEYLPIKQQTDQYGVVYNLPIRCSEAIISFGMESEEIRVIPHPSGADDNLCTTSYSRRKRRHKTMALLEMEGKLCLCDGSYYQRKLDIWVMDDYSKQIWTKRYVVRLDKLLPFSPHPTNHTVLPWVKALCIHNRNELVFQWYPWDRRGRRHLDVDYMVYNLEKGGRCRKIKEGLFTDKKQKYNSGTCKRGNLVSHIPSSENVGRETGSVLSLYEDDKGNNKLVVYDYENHHVAQVY